MFTSHSKLYRTTYVVNKNKPLTLQSTGREGLGESSHRKRGKTLCINSQIYKPYILNKHKQLPSHWKGRL